MADHLTETLRTISELAIESRCSYQTARAKALRGEYGRVVRIGHSLFVEQGPPEGPDSPKAA